MLFRYFIKLSYKGTCFHGWQVQPNSVTVQESLIKAFSLFLKEDIYVIGCGRTDTGVHAKNFYAHFDTIYEIQQINDLIYKLNRYIHKDIVIHEIFKVHNDLHSRFDAISRTYQYRYNLYKDPFVSEFSTYLRQKPNIERMNSAAQILFKYKDFTSFSKLHTDTTNNNCTIYEAHWTIENNVLIFEIKANRFLRNMVRAIVGTLIEVGTGKIDLEGFEKIIQSKNRSNAGFSVPAQGLCLTEVRYKDDAFF